MKILAYHSIGTKVDEVGAGLYCVSEDNFRAQMEYLVHSPQSMVHRNIEITFDDGLLDNYTIAYPILKKLGLRAYFFILVSRVGMPGYMSWEQIKELKDAGMIIGSHGMTHRILAGLKDKDLDYELGTSKRILEEHLGNTADCLSIPRGFYNEKIIKKAQGLGYREIFTFDRITVKTNWTLEQFVDALNGKYSMRHRVKEFTKAISKRILGVNAYDRVRTVILK